jgi:hypothetical protein
MLAEMPASLWWEWIAYSRVEPFGEERADLRAGIIASVIANAHRDRKRGKTFRPSDFMPKFGQRPKVQSVEEMIEIARQITLALGGQDLRKNKGDL